MPAGVSNNLKSKVNNQQFLDLGDAGWRKQQSKV
jgi:hypothetical protein